ncbi:MAG: ATP-dependent sacrificial sulfur transferase LarE [Actinobacteria bacterium]|nr:MAG: ATP-dependent sacrificial sulfur transferase LarE [Actinomycetota bacterium]
MIELLSRLERRIAGYGAPRAVVAFSGGVDSSVVTALAARALGAGQVTAVTAVSPSYPSGELEQARRTARSLSVRHRVIETHEVEREAYARNDGLRCYRCKMELYSELRKLSLAAGEDGSLLVAGANADDAADVRPGLLAAEQRGVRNPLLEEGAGKEAVRGIARHLGLAVADKPALACLSSRVAFGIRITPDLLARIDRAEQAVRALGFDQVRVRHFGDRASIEVPEDEVAKLQGHLELTSVLREFKSIGWSSVEIDPAGYQQGRMNATLPSPGVVSRS